MGHSDDRFVRADMVAAMRETMSMPGMRRYAVRIGEVIAGGASMHVDPQGVAQLCGAEACSRRCCARDSLTQRRPDATWR